MQLKDPTDNSDEDFALLDSLITDFKVDENKED